MEKNDEMQKASSVNEEQFCSEVILMLQKSRQNKKVLDGMQLGADKNEENKKALDSMPEAGDVPADGADVHDRQTERIIRTTGEARGKASTCALWPPGSRLVNEKESIMTTPLLLRAYGFRSSVTS